MSAINEESGNALGIDFVTIVAYIIIFLVLYYFTRSFVNKVIDTTEKRKQEIEEGLRNAQEAEALKMKAQTEADREKKDIIQKAYSEADQIVEKSKSKEESIISEAKIKHENILKEAEVELLNLKNNIKREGMSEAQEIINLSLKKTLEGFSVPRDVEEKLIAEAIESAQKSGK
jgi:F0F1-type ATP synthase membrane subunit b/b'